MRAHWTGCSSCPSARSGKGRATRPGRRTIASSLVSRRACSRPRRVRGRRNTRSSRSVRARTKRKRSRVWPNGRNSIPASRNFSSLPMCSWIRCAAGRQRGTVFGSTSNTFRKSSGPRPARRGPPARLPARPEDLLQLVSRSDFELIVAAVAGFLVGAPALKDRSVSEAIAFHVIVLHFADALDAQRFPRQVFSRAPTALPARHAGPFRLGARPCAPGMVLQPVLAERRELLHELLAHRHGECRRDAHVLQHPAVVIETEEE